MPSSSSMAGKLSRSSSVPPGLDRVNEESLHDEAEASTSKPRASTSSSRTRTSTQSSNDQSASPPSSQASTVGKVGECRIRRRSIVGFIDARDTIYNHSPTQWNTGVDSRPNNDWIQLWRIAHSFAPGIVVVHTFIRWWNPPHTIPGAAFQRWSEPSGTSTKWHANCCLTWWLDLCYWEVHPHQDKQPASPSLSNNAFFTLRNTAICQPNTTS